MLVDIRQNLEDTKPLYYSLSTLQKVASFAAVVLASKAAFRLKFKSSNGGGMRDGDDPGMLALASLSAGIVAGILEISKNTALDKDKNLRSIDAAIESANRIQLGSANNRDLNSKAQSIIDELNKMKEQVSSIGTIRNSTAGINIISSLLMFFGGLAGDNGKFAIASGSIAMSGTLALSVVDLLSLLKDSDRELVLKKVAEVQPKVEAAINSLSEIISTAQ